MTTELNEALLEGTSANDWTPGAWANTPNIADDEWQPDIEPPHINDYAAFKKHKHYGKYFRPYRYTPFPAWMYHATLEPKIVKSKEEVLALGPEWSPVPNKPRVDMTGKSLPVKSDTQRLAETIALALPRGAAAAAPIDATMIASIVAAVVAAMPQMQPAAIPAAPSPDDLMPPREPTASEDVERSALLELAAKENIKVDGRWSNERIKKELGL
jgi:hypothetical protein